MNLLDEVAEERDRVVVARYLGWDGQGIRTLRLVADDFKVTRERVRQICSRVRNALKALHPYTPTLNSVLNFIEQQMPAPVADIESRLNTSGLTTGAFRLEGIINFAEVLAEGRTLAFKIRLGDELQFRLKLRSSSATFCKSRGRVFANMAP